MSNTNYQSLPCRLTQSERDERATQMAKTHRECVESETAAKAVAAQAKEKQTELKAELARLAKAIESGSEPRMVECREEVDVLRFMVQTFRCDTGEVVSSRGMTVREQESAQQGKLFGSENTDRILQATADAINKGTLGPDVKADFKPGSPLKAVKGDKG